MKEAIKDDWENWMDAYQNRKIYSDFTLEELKAIPDNLILFAIEDFVIEKIASEDLAEVYDKFKTLPVAHQFIFAVRTFISEVNNGGFDQFFFNSSSFFVKEAHAGLGRMEAIDVMAILNKAMTLVYKDLNLLTKMKAGDLRVSITDPTIKAALTKLESELKTDHIDGMMIAYVQQHLSEFVTASKN